MKIRVSVFDLRFPVQLRERAAHFRQIVNLKSQIKNYSAFTLIELLAVIAIIGILAGFTIPVLHAVKIRQYETHAQAEMAQLETAIESYKAAYGFYPPDSPNSLNYPWVNQLYYELVGTTNTSNSPLTFQTLDGSQTLIGGQLNTAFGTSVNGFINCSKPGAGEDSPAARNFLPGLKPNQIGTFGSVTSLVTSVSGTDPNYLLLGVSGVNPWRYNSSNPTNNPGAYDLYVQLQISGKKYLICNWSKQVQINSPLP